MPTEAEVSRLAHAMWNLLDDMGREGQSVCGLAKAEARVAYEPFMTDEPGANDDLMTLGAAKKLIAEHP